jgi:putative membrane protein
MPRSLLGTLVIIASIALTNPLGAQTTPTDPPVATAPSTDPNAPLTGANSFTESQAKDRIEKAGFTQVSSLKKDDNGIWRGTAMRGGTQTNVALDYRGNVVVK